MSGTRNTDPIVWIESLDDLDEAIDGVERYDSLRSLSADDYAFVHRPVGAMGKPGWRRERIGRTTKTQIVTDHGETPFSRDTGDSIPRSRREQLYPVNDVTIGRIRAVFATKSQEATERAARDELITLAHSLGRLSPAHVAAGIEALRHIAELEEAR